MIYTLIIDTSTERGQIVVALGKEVCSHVELPFGLESSKFLMHSIKNCFESLNITVLDLKAVAVSIGPGSFTGIRVGASFAMALSHARKIPLISLGSLESLISESDGEFVSLIDAKIQSGYLLLQKKEGEKVTPLSEPRMIPLQELEPLLCKAPFVVTPSPGKLKGCLPNSINWVERGPDPKHAASLAEEAFLRKSFSTSGECQLNYISHVKIG